VRGVMPSDRLCEAIRITEKEEGYGSKAQEQATLALKEGEPRQEACLGLRKARALLDGAGGIGDGLAARPPQASANSARRCGTGGRRKRLHFPPVWTRFSDAIGVARRLHETADLGR
jgi:hypothetical protein